MDVGLVLTIVGLALTAVVGVPPMWQAHRRSRTHVRQLWVRLETRWRPVDGAHNDRVRDGARLVVRNNGPHSVWDVIVMRPESLSPTDFKSVGPGEVLEVEISEATMFTITDETVTVQVTDNFGQYWLWTPLAQELRNPSTRLTPLASIVQASARLWPESWESRFARLPKGLQRVLWGYDPAGDEPSPAEKTNPPDIGLAS